jgi:hypothetical protein
MMELVHALKAGVLPAGTCPVDIVLTAFNEGLHDIVQKQIIINHELLRAAKDPDDARTKFQIINDLTELELSFLNNLKIWSNKSSSDNKVGNFLKHSHRKKVYCPVDDRIVTHCFKCGVAFGLFVRKHHCRSCGRIFCYNCSQWLENIPKDLTEHAESYSWFTTDKNLRVCQACKEAIASYRRVEKLVQYFEIVSYPVELCLRALTLNRDWCDAMKIYLSNFRQLQHYSPTTPLLKRDTQALLSNIDNIQGHNKWLLQALKIGLIKNDGNRKISCTDMLCEHNCSDHLTPFDALIILNAPNYNFEVRLYALKMLEDNKFPNDIMLFLPVENPGVQEFILKRPILFLDFFWSSRINQCLTMDIFRNKLLLANPEQGRDAQESLRLISYLDKYHANKYELSRHLQSLAVPFIGPFGSIGKFEQDIVIKQSVTRPVFIRYIGDGRKQAFLYKREDIRKDAHIVALIRLMYHLCTDIFDKSTAGKRSLSSSRSHPSSSEFMQQDPGKYLVTYRVVPVSVDGGFIEIVPDASTLTDILAQGSISNYLYRSNPEKKVSDVSSNYSVSLAFWTVVTYVLGVGDRHMENIMIRKDGVLFHIDYGFVFGSDTISSVIRLDANLIEALGGTEMYKPFKLRCQEIFCRLRQHFNIICACLLRLSSLEPPIKHHNFSQQAIERFISSRFLFGQTEDEAKEAFSNIIDANRDTLMHKVTDVIHSTVNNLKVTWWNDGNNK